MKQRLGAPRARRAVVVGLFAMVSWPAAPAHATRLFVSQAGLGAGGAAVSQVIVDAAAATDLAMNRRPVLLEDVPLPDGSAAFRVEPIDVFSPTASVVEFDGKTEKRIGRPDVAVYAGADGGRDLAVSIVGGRTVWAVVREKGRLVALIHPHGDAATSGVHALIAANAIALPDRKLCDNDVPMPGGSGSGGSAAAPPPTSGLPPGPTLAAEVLVDVGYDLYTDVFGTDSVSAAEYAANLFGAVSVMYRRDVNVAVLISQLVIWTAPDPFAGPDSLTQLNAYDSWNESNRAGVPRDTAHLLANVETAGGRAYLSALCSTGVGYGVSNIDGGLAQFPTAGPYVWDLMVIAHELGHNFGSLHTHCYNPPLDHCYNQEPGCYGGPVEPTVGEIMSYCHLVQGVDMHFSDTVGAVVRAGAEAGSCIGAAPGPCGDGEVDPGEQCDDGNTADGDCCGANCVFEAAGAQTGQYCTEDGDPCTTDTCDGMGTCVHVPPGQCAACGAPTVIPAAGGTFNSFMTGMSTLDGSCGGAGPEQVFEWTPTLSGLANVATCGSPLDTVVYVREGTCDLGMERGCSDDACFLQSDVSFSSVAGTTYYIVVDSYSASSVGGSFTLSVTPGKCGDGDLYGVEQCDDGNVTNGDCCSATCTFESTTTACTDDGDPCTTDVCDGAGGCAHVPPGTCNACSVPTPIPAAGGVFAGVTAGPSTLTGCASSLGAERAYEWTPAVSGLATISTCGGTTNYDTVLSVRNVGCTSVLACNDDACALASSLQVTVTAGQTYIIVVDGYSGNGNYTLTVSPPVVCGDGTIGGTEECDDGNLDPNDGCTDVCTLCGNGVLAALEECDDGNLASNDGCSAACRFVCPTAPLGGCRLPTLPRKSVIKLKQGTLDTKDVFGWKWSSGTVTTKAEFGSPLISHGYLLCVYDGNGHAFTTFAPPGGTCGTRPCWTEKPTGYKYVDKELTPRGVSKLDLKEGLVAGKAKANLKGKGALLGLPSTSALVSPVRVQLLRPGGPCFEGTFSAPFVKQDGVQFKDLSD